MPFVGKTHANQGLGSTISFSELKSEMPEKLKNWQTHANQGLRRAVSFSTQTKEAMMLLAATQLHRKYVYYVHQLYSSNEHLYCHQ